MTHYINQRPNAPIHAIEFAMVDGMPTCFFHLAPGNTRADVESALTRANIHQTILSEAKMGDHALIVTQGNIAPEQVLSAFAAQGEQFVTPPAPEKKFNPWAWRAITSIVGQSLQMVSSFTSSGAKADRSAVFGFASLNLIANFINYVFGAQKKNDPHQTRMLKEHFNAAIAPELTPGTALPNPDETQLGKYANLEPQKTPGQKLYDVVQKYSVSGGEIGLRTLGSVSLAFPLNQWKNAATAMKESGSLGERIGKAFRATRNSNLKTFNVGLAMLTGKFVSFLAKEPDPYNPQPPSLIDRIREKVMFKLSSVIEGGAATYMAVDRFKNQKIELGGKQYADHFGGWGNVVFVGGYAVRYFAPYGSLEVNMPELYTHIADGIAKLPPEKIPGMLAQAAIDLKQHFINKPLEVSTLYAELAATLKNHHGIDLTPATTTAQTPIAANIPERPEPKTQLVAHHERIEKHAPEMAITSI